MGGLTERAGRLQHHFSRGDLSRPACSHVYITRTKQAWGRMIRPCVFVARPGFFYGRRHAAMGVICPLRSPQLTLPTGNRMIIPRAALRSFTGRAGAVVSPPRFRLRHCGGMRGALSRRGPRLHLFSLLQSQHLDVRAPLVRPGGREGRTRPPPPFGGGGPRRYLLTCATAITSSRRKRCSARAAT